MPCFCSAIYIKTYTQIIILRQACLLHRVPVFGCQQGLTQQGRDPPFDVVFTTFFRVRWHSWRPCIINLTISQLQLWSKGMHVSVAIH